MEFRDKSIIKLVEEYSEGFLINRQDPFDIERLVGRLYGGDDTRFWCYFRNPGTLAGQVLGAIEMACWDIIGKATNQPVYNLLGGRYHDRLRSYSYIYDWAPGEPPEKVGDAALAILERGFTAVKFDPIFPLFPAARPISLAELNYVDLVLAAIRDKVGNRMDILIGTHGQLNTQSAIRLAKVLERYDPLWFEEPVPLENKHAMGVVARGTTVPVATGERLTSKWEFQQVLENDAAAIIQVNVGLTGLLEAKKIAGLAETHYAQIAPWTYCGPISAAASMQLDVCSPNFLIQEGIEDWTGFPAEILHEPIEWENGFVIPSRRPGLGVEPDEKVLAKYPPHELSSEVLEAGLRRFDEMGPAIAKYV
jgi:L-alanine-DL-glutamate epimerase-like enolase superfamily enzyme